MTGYNPKTYFNYGNTYTHTIFYPTKTTTNGKSTQAKERSDINTDYEYTGSDVLTDTTSIKYKMIFRDKVNANNIEFWLASRNVSSTSDNAIFYLPTVFEGIVNGIGFLKTPNPDCLDKFTNTAGVRPIVYLKSNIKTSGQNENGVWQIIE